MTTTREHGSRAGLAVDVTVDDRLRAEFTVEPGEVLAVIGPNGAGKTTLLRAVAGLVDLRGSVQVDGESWTQPPRLVRDRRIGFVLQERSLFPHLSALENVAFGLRAGGLARAVARGRAREWLDRLGVGDLADRRPKELSGGQAQRVALARALALDPAVLLLDEPFAGLDVGVATALRLELVRHLADYDGIALLVTHDALDALTIADQVLVLDRGEVVQQGTPREVAARPLTDHVARLVGLNVQREGESFAAFPPTSVTVSLAEPAGSARHRWRGRVLSVVPHGPAVRVLVDSDPQILADVTPAAAAELALAPGREVWLSVKETAVTWYSQP